MSGNLGNSAYSFKASHPYREDQKRIEALISREHFLGAAQYSIPPDEHRPTPIELVHFAAKLNRFTQILLAGNNDDMCALGTRNLLHKSFNYIFETIISDMHNEEAVNAASVLLRSMSFLTRTALRKGLLTPEQAEEFNMFATNGTLALAENNQLRIIGKSFLHQHDLELIAASKRPAVNAEVPQTRL